MCGLCVAYLHLWLNFMCVFWYMCIIGVVSTVSVFYTHAVYLWWVTHAHCVLSACVVLGTVSVVSRGAASYTLHCPHKASIPLESRCCPFCVATLGLSLSHRRDEK